MRVIDAASAESYLRQTGRIAPDEQVTIRELSGGVSNVVLYVACSPAGREDFVLKQSRDRLRVEDPWFCSVERIWREVEVLRLCETLLADDSGERQLVIKTPWILFEDRENFAFAMTAAPPEHVVWKSELLAGRVKPEISAACGRLLGRMHAGTWRDGAVASRFGDRQFFDDLRIDPFYRHIADVHEHLRPAVKRLIESGWAHAECLVHGDFSPKNLLVYDDGLMMVDCEAGHYGDPAFDVGFFLSHLVLKAFCRAPDFERFLAISDTFCEAYHGELAHRVSEQERRSLTARAVRNFAGCALARLDGKSKVSYLRCAARRDAIRTLCVKILHTPPPVWKDVLDLARTHLTALEDDLSS